MTVDDRLRDYAARWNAASPPPPDPRSATAPVVTPARNTGRPLSRPGRRWAVATAGLALVVGATATVGFVVDHRGGRATTPAAASPTPAQPSGSPTPNPTTEFGVTANGPVIPASRRIPAPEIGGAELGGGTRWSLAAHAGQVVVVAVWGSWCRPCQDFAPALDGLAGPDVAVVGFAVQEADAALTNRFVADRGITYPVVADAGSSLVAPLASKLYGVPQVFLVDREGRVAAWYVGTNARPDLERAVAAVAAE